MCSSPCPNAHDARDGTQFAGWTRSLVAVLLILGLVLGSIVLTMFFAVNCYDETASAFRQARVSVRDVMQDADWYGRASVGFRAAHAHAGAYCCPQAATRALEQRHAGWDRGDADQVRRCIRRYVLKVRARHRRVWCLTTALATWQSGWKRGGRTKQSSLNRRGSGTRRATTPQLTRRTSCERVLSMTACGRLCGRRLDGR